MIQLLGTPDFMGYKYECKVKTTDPNWGLLLGKTALKPVHIIMR
jgi:hypothetical protein